jgi:arsenate reductase
MKEKDQIIAICKALSDPGRLEVLAALDTEEMCLCDLAERLGLADSTVSRHMMILEQAGLVESRKDGRWRYFRHAQVDMPGPAQYAVAWIRKCIKGSGLDESGMVRQGKHVSVCETKTNVLFLCSGNSCRSQIAEAYLRKYGNDLFHVYSAGLEPKGIDPMTVEVMQEVGVDISNQKSKGVLDFIGRMHFGYLITVCSRAEEICPIFPGISFRFFWPFEDPVKFNGADSSRLLKFRQVRDAIEKKIIQWVQEYRANERGREEFYSRK